MGEGLKLRDMFSKKNMRAGFVGAGVALIISGGGMYGIYNHGADSESKLRGSHTQEMTKLQEVAEMSEEVYTLVGDLERGDLINEEKVKAVKIPRGAKSEDSVSLADINGGNYYARVDLKSNTTLVESMVYINEVIGNDVREAEYAFIDLPTTLKVEDYIDLRIQFPNGEDYVLFSKKQVKDRVGVTMWLDVDEGEQLLMSSAIVDAYVEGAKIYANPYVDGAMQDDASVTYPVKGNVRELIEASPNVVNVAKLSLESQARQQLEGSLQQVTQEMKSKKHEGAVNTNSKVIRDENERKMNKINENAITQEELVGTPAN